MLENGHEFALCDEGEEAGFGELFGEGEEEVGELEFYYLFFGLGVFDQTEGDLGEDDFAHGEVVGCLYGVQSGLGVEFHQSVLKAAGESLFSCAFEKDSGELFVEAGGGDDECQAEHEYFFVGVVYVIEDCQ